MSTRSWKPLWEALQDAAESGGADATSVSNLRAQLRAYDPLLLRPLERPRPSPPVRDRLLREGVIDVNGRPCDLRQHSAFVSHVVSLSNTLDLSEVDCVRFVREAGVALSLFPAAGGSLEVVAEQLHNEDRKLQLLCLKSMVMMAGDESVRERAPKTFGEVDAEVRWLVGRGLAEGIAKRVAEVVEELRGKTTVAERRRSVMREELEDLCVVLFHVTFQFAVGLREVMAVLRLFRELAELTTSGEESSSAVADPIEKARDLLLLSLVAVMDPTARMVAGDKDGTGPRVMVDNGKRLLDDTGFLKEARDVLVSEWKVLEKRAPLLLAWGVLINTADASQFRSQGVEEGAWAELTRVVVSPLIEENPDDALVLITAAQSLLLSFANVVAATNGTSAAFPTEEPHKLVALLDFIAASYGRLPKGQPDTFFRNESLVSMVHVTLGQQQHHPELVSPLADALASLATAGTEGAAQVYSLLAGPRATRRFCWPFFFQAFASYAAEIRKRSSGMAIGGPVSQSTRRSGLTPQDTRGLCSIASLVSAVCENSERVRQVSLEPGTLPVNPLEATFSLLSCRVPTVLKARLMEVIYSFCKSKQGRDMTWKLLEESGILHARQLIIAPPPTLPSSLFAIPQQVQAPMPEISVGGKHDTIIHELEEVEAPSRHFPYVTAFVELVRRLVRADASDEQKMTRYVAFVKDSVLGKLWNWQFEDQREQWLLCERCLAVIHDVLTRTDLLPSEVSSPSSLQQSPLFIVLQDIMSNASTLQTVVQIVRDAAGPLAPSLGPSFLRCVSLSLKILNAALAHEASLPRGFPGARRLYVSLGDVPVSVAKLLSWVSTPGVSLNSARVLHQLSHQSANGLLAAVLGIEPARSMVISSFIQVLQNRVAQEEEEDDESDDGANRDQDDGSAMGGEERETTRWVLVKMLTRELDQPDSNLCCALLEVGSAHTAQQTTGTQSQTVSLLTVILGMLGDADRLWQRHPRLFEAVSEFIYKLCSHRQTAPHVLPKIREGASDLRWLRRAVDAISEQVPNGQSAPALASNLYALSWILRTVAIGVKTMAAGRSWIERTERSIEALLGRQDRLVPSVLQVLSRLSPEMPSAVTPRYFASLDVKSCMRPNSRGVNVTQVASLHSLLNVERERLRATRIPEQELDAEALQILQAAVDLNSFANVDGGLCSAHEALSSVLQVLFFTGAADGLGQKSLDHVLLMLAQAILQALSGPALPEGAFTPLASAMLAVSSKLRYSRAVSDFEGDETRELVRGEVLLHSLASIAEGFAASLMNQRGGSQSRGILYGALYHYLQFATRSPQRLEALAQVAALSQGGDQDTELVLLSELKKKDEDTRDAVATALSSFKLLELMWRDSLSPGANRALCAVGLSALKALAECAPTKDWLGPAASNGCIKSLVASLAPLMREVMQSTDSGATGALQSLALLETRMSLLCSLAKTQRGAGLLQQADTLAEFQKTPVLEELATLALPKDNAASEDEEMVDSTSISSSLVGRFRQLVCPVFRLAHAMLVTLGENLSVASDVLGLLRVLSGPLLADIAGPRSLESLRITSAVTSVLRELSRTPDAMTQEVFDKLLRLSLKSFKAMSRMQEEGDEERQRLATDIALNVMTCCRLSSETNPLFSARWEEGPQPGPSSLQPLVVFLRSGLRRQRALNELMQRLVKERTHVTELSADRLTELSKRAVPEANTRRVEDLPMQHRRRLAVSQLHEESTAVQRELSQLRVALETCLFVLATQAQSLLSGRQSRGAVIPPGFVAEKEELRSRLSYELNSVERTGERSVLHGLIAELEPVVHPSVVSSCVKMLRSLTDSREFLKR